MNANSKIKSLTVQASVLVLCLISSTSLMARGGGGGGNFGGHGGGGNFGGHDGGWNNNGNHNDGYNYNNYNDHNYYNPGYNSGNVIVVPGGDDSDCESSQVCNSYGQCWTQQNCD